MLRVLEDKDTGQTGPCPTVINLCHHSSRNYPPLPSVLLSANDSGDEREPVLGFVPGEGCNRSYFKENMFEEGV